MKAPKNEFAKAILRKKFEDVLMAALDGECVYGTLGMTLSVVNDALQKYNVIDNLEYRLPKVNQTA